MKDYATATFSSAVSKIANNLSIIWDSCIVSNGGRGMHQEISLESFQAG